MVRSQLQLGELPRPFDAADALAVALCHIHSQRARTRLAAAMETESIGSGLPAHAGNGNKARRASGTIASSPATRGR
jgi:hypothetical protein